MKKLFAHVIEKINTVC